MSMKMYTVDGDCPDNEELALRIQAGNKKAAELLISKNGFITIGEPFVGKKRTPSHSVCTPNKVRLDQHLNVYNKTVNYQKVRLFL